MGATSLSRVGSGRTHEDLKANVLRTTFWILAAATGFLQIWPRDRVIWGDTLSYLDTSDLLWRGDFANAITNHWSLGYPILLGLAIRILHPVGLWEVAVVKLVDFIILLFTIGCFDFLVSRFCRYHEKSLALEHSRSMLMVSKLALMSASYLLFLWTILQLLPAWYSTPDMLSMGILFLVFGFLLEIKMGKTGFYSFIMLGVVLGFGYLVKAPMFPLAFLFLGVAFFLVNDRKKAVPRVALSFALFALLAAPIVFELSMMAGGLTFGKSGAWNYARNVNGIVLPYHWRGQPAGTGTPLHPTREIFKNPTVYEFGSPVLGTFPPWRDPYYWYAGITPHFELARQLAVIKGNLKSLARQAMGLNGCFVYAFLVLLCIADDKRLVGRIIARQWFLLLPAIAALAMFSLVLVEDRYIAPYPLIIGMVVFSGVAVVRSAASLRLVHVCVLLAAAFFAASSLRAAAGQRHSFAQSLHWNDLLGRGGPWNVTAQAVSDALRTHGLQSGDKVAYIGERDDFYWARLAGVRVNAEIRQWDLDKSIVALAPHGVVEALEPSVDIYWASSPAVKQEIDRLLIHAGSKAVITGDFKVSAGDNGWDPVPGTPFYIRMLSQDRTGK